MKARVEAPRPSEAERVRAIAVRAALDALGCVLDLTESRRERLRAMLEAELSEAE